MLSTLSAILLPVLLLGKSSTAQSPTPTLLPSTLPACAQQCPVLIQAQAGCLPQGGAPVTNQATYQSCFCQSALLTQLAVSNLCSPTCSAGDFGTIQAWYKSLCAPGAAVVTPNPGTSSAGGSTTLGTVTSTAASLPGGTAASGSATAVPGTTTADGSQGGWFSSHWRWVIMIIILFIGFLALGLLASFLHKRYRRRQASASRGVGAQPDLGTWGPQGRSVHDFGEALGTREKGKGREDAAAAAVQGGGGGEVARGKSGRGSKRLKKAG